MRARTKEPVPGDYPRLPSMLSASPRRIAAPDAAGFLPALSSPDRPAAREWAKQGMDATMYRTHLQQSSVAFDSPRRRALDATPTSSFAPAIDPVGGARFVERSSERDRRLVPGPGEYEPAGSSAMGRQISSTARTHRASTFAKPFALSPDTQPSRKSRHIVSMARKLLSGRQALEALNAMWDTNRDGIINQEELGVGLSSLGLSLSSAELRLLFTLYNINDDEGIDLRELCQAIRNGGIKWEAVHDQVERHHNHSLTDMPTNCSPRRRKNVFGHLHISMDSDVPVVEQLRTALSSHALRVMELFREWDTSADGSLTRKEFEVGIRRLGIETDSDTICALFDEWE